MDEMGMLRNVLATPGPSDEAVRQGRRELQKTIHHPVRASGRRSHWRAPAIGLAAASVTAGAVTAAAVLTWGAAPATPGGRLMSARRVLLAAATSAERTPAGSGTYWHVRWSAPGGAGRTPVTQEEWAKRDGESWSRANRGSDTRVEKKPSSMHGPFFMAGQELTFQQIQDLPGQPGALERWIANSTARHGNPWGGPPSEKGWQQQEIFDSLTQLISELPAPPAVRAAAFRAMAVFPGVKNLGPMKGGQGLQFTLPEGGSNSPGQTLVIDPSAGQLRYTSFIVLADGSFEYQATGPRAIPGMTITEQWTNTLP